ncbi:MAG: NAD(P)/FAD-dependent oxidoreductase [Phycisphaeraceae bacterium]
MHTSRPERPILIIGAGVAGLACATELHRDAYPFLLLEASDAPGGRMRTDHLDGFTLDRGFQIFLTGYDYASSLLDLDALDLHPFEAGSLIRWNNGFARFSDPWRRPARLFETLFVGPGNLMDRFRIGRLRTMARSARHDDQPSDETAAQLFDRLHFTPQFRQAFLDPWWRGVLLDRHLTAPASYLKFIFNTFSQGGAVIPARGIQSIPIQLAQKLPTDSIRLNTTVHNIDPNRHAVTLSTGEQLSASSVILAADPSSTAQLLNQPAPSMHGTTVLYFAADKPPVEDRMLVLNSNPEGYFNHVCVLSNICPALAPSGASLISVTAIHPILEPNDLQASIIKELSTWFGPQTRTWRHLRTYTIPNALPPISRSTALPLGITPAGDWTTTPSIEGAMRSGKQAAENAISLVR